MTNWMQDVKQKPLKLLGVDQYSKWFSTNYTHERWPVRISADASMFVEVFFPSLYLPIILGAI